MLVSLRSSCVVVASFLLVSCGAPEPSPDGGDEHMHPSMMTDGGGTDAGLDAGAVDSGLDAGETDAGTPDAGTPDAGMPDAGMPDAGTPDAGTPDAGEADAGTSDAGTRDAGLMVCTPTQVVSCYEGPAGTQGVGRCIGGTKTCASDGLSFGACAGQILPATEICGNGLDDNCDGQPDEGCPQLVTYSNTAKAIFAAKCASCHTTGGSGGGNIGSSYADTQLGAYSCIGKTKGACALDRIKSGSMPPGAGCDTNPAGAACVTPAQQAQLQEWIDGGQLP